MYTEMTSKQSALTIEHLWPQVCPHRMKRGWNDREPLKYTWTLGPRWGILLAQFIDSLEYELYTFMKTLKFLWLLSHTLLTFVMQSWYRMVERNKKTRNYHICRKNHLATPTLRQLRPKKMHCMKCYSCGSQWYHWFVSINPERTNKWLHSIFRKCFLVNRVRGILLSHALQWEPLLCQYINS